MKKIITKYNVTKAIEKALNNQKEVRKYLNNEITKEELESKGIKIAKKYCSSCQ